MAIRAQLQCKYCGFMSFNFGFFFLVLDADLNSPDFFCGIGKNKNIPHGTDCAKSSRVRTSFDYFKDFEVCEVKDKYFGLKDNDAFLGVNSGGFDL